jgi:predicted O-linked N-acetylglucosamine transferase (SPINDLY family)
MSSNVLLMNRARESHARGDLAAAARGYENILKLDPRNFEATYFLAVAHYQAGRLERAADLFGAAAALNPRRVEPQKDRGLVLMKLGQYDEALACFERAVTLAPGNPELLLNRGIAQKNAGRIADSVASYEAALRLKPGLAEAHNNLANSLSLLDRKEEALRSYTQAFTLKPGYAEARVNAALLLQQMERPSEALPVLERAIAGNPRHAEAHRVLAECLLATGRTQEALAAATRAIERDPASPDAYLTRASIHDTAKQESEALNDYDSALALAPRNTFALLGKARLLCHEARYDEAVALCDAAIAAAPQEAKAYYGIGRALEGRRELAAAIVSYEKATELDPQWLGPVLRRARVLREMGKDQEALAAFEQTIAIHPDLAEAHLGKGDVLRALSRFEEALASYDRAISLAPEKPIFFGIRGSLQVEMGNADAALQDFGQGLKVLAAGKPASVAMTEDCIKLLSVDKIPGVYATEAEVAATREKVEAALDDLDRSYDGNARLSVDQTMISEQAVRQLTGFYLAYHQYNDRETMAKLSRVSKKLLSLTPYQIPARRLDGRKIRVGIASQRLRNHNGANWAYNWFAGLPQGDYDIFTYAFERSDDPLAAKFAALGTHRPLTWSRSRPHELVQQMRNDELDILMLTDVGMTAVSRFLSLHRIAPCQFTAWGHPVTTGSAEMDFYLSSDLMEPENGQDHYTEKLIRMPNLALYLDEEDAGVERADPATFGLPEGRVLYGCLQSLFKYLPRHDHILPRIASEVPDALFVFLEGSQSYMTRVMKERLQNDFARFGLDAGRHVTFLPRQKPREFDRLMQSMDVCIDSVGWSGGNTTLRNINFGAPLATLAGEFMRGRHSSAMFRMIGADEMIASSTEEYIAKLIQLGREKAYRDHCSALFRSGRHRLYRDQSFIDAFDAFLKSRVRS